MMTELEHEQHSTLCEAEMNARAAKDSFRPGSAEWVSAAAHWFGTIRDRDAFRVEMSAQGKAYCSPLRVIFEPF